MSLFEIDWPLTGEVAGIVAQFLGAVLMLITGFCGVGAFLGAVYAWLRQPEPDWQQGMAYGSMIGGTVGIFATTLDILL